MATYKLSIDDKLDPEGRIIQRNVMAASGALRYKEFCNPNEKSKKPFRYEGHKFDTSFSIVHPFRKIARCISLNDIFNGDSDDKKPVIKYEPSVNDAQIILFGNILAQEYEAAKEYVRRIPQQAQHGF